MTNFKEQEELAKNELEFRGKQIDKFLEAGEDDPVVYRELRLAYNNAYKDLAKARRELRKEEIKQYRTSKG